MIFVRDSVKEAQKAVGKELRCHKTPSLAVLLTSLWPHPAANIGGDACCQEANYTPASWAWPRNPYLAGDPHLTRQQSPGPQACQPRSTWANGHKLTDLQEPALIQVSWSLVKANSCPPSPPAPPPAGPPYLPTASCGQLLS